MFILGSLALISHSSFSSSPVEAPKHSPYYRNNFLEKCVALDKFTINFCLTTEQLDHSSWKSELENRLSLSHHSCGRKVCNHPGRSLWNRVPVLPVKQESEKISWKEGVLLSSVNVLRWHKDILTDRTSYYFLWLPYIHSKHVWQLS